MEFPMYPGTAEREQKIPLSWVVQCFKTQPLILSGPWLFRAPVLLNARCTTSSLMTITLSVAMTSSSRQARGARAPPVAKRVKNLSSLAVEGTPSHPGRDRYVASLWKGRLPNRADGESPCNIICCTLSLYWHLAFLISSFTSLSTSSTGFPKESTTFNSLVTRGTLRNILHVFCGGSPNEHNSI